MINLWETTKPSPQLLAERELVSTATQLVNDRYEEHGREDRVVSSIASDASLDKQVQKTAIEIAYARGDWSLSFEEKLEQITQKATSNPELARRLLVRLVETESGVDVDEQKVNSPKQTGIAWYLKAEEVASQFSQAEYQGLLTSQISAHPDAHHFVFLRGLNNARRGKWRDAERDLTTALARVPDKSSAWHNQAYQLAHLRLYLGEIEEYRSLCERVLNEFADTGHANHAERTGLLCVLAPDLPFDLDRAEALIDVAMTHEQNKAFPYFSFAKGIAQYRRGELRHALSYLGPAERHTSLNLRVRALCYKALCLHKLEEPESAREVLTAAEQIIKSDTYPQPDGDEFPIGWADWISVQLAYQEAVKDVR